ncbi:MAG: DUF4350 domain-containing protein [Candidatus Helarchaeota archaeon]
MSKSQSKNRAKIASKKIFYPANKNNEGVQTKKEKKETSKPLVILGLIIFIAGIIAAFIFYGSMWYSFIAILIIFLGVYIVYKGLTKTPSPASKEHRQIVILFIIFGIFFAPIFFSLIQMDQVLAQPYSTTNIYGTGCSNFRTMLQSQGYETKSLLSSYSELQRISNYHSINNTLLIILGPKKLIGLFEVVSLLDFLTKGGSIFIACDLGTANEIALFQPFAAIFGGGGFSFIEFENGYLYKESSGYNFDVSTSVGVIRIYRGSCIQSSLGGGGTAYLNAVTPSDTWVDKNFNGVFDPDSEEKGSYSLAYKSSNIIYFSDVELFTNQHLDASGYSHRAFAMKIINDITHGNTNYLILFDESHQVKNGLHPSFLFGFILGNVNFFQFYWALVPVGIYLVYKIINKFIPNYAKKKKKELKKEMKIKHKAEKKEKIGSVYITKLNWYKRLGRYRDATILLYNRLKRTLVKKLKFNSWDLDNVIEAIINSHFEEENFDDKRLIKDFDELEKIANKQINVSSEEDFLNKFLEMKWISDQL